MSHWHHLIQHEIRVGSSEFKIKDRWGLESNTGCMGAVSKDKMTTSYMTDPLVHFSVNARVLTSYHNLVDMARYI